MKIQIKFYLIFIILFTTVLYSQKRRTDSISYYSNLSEVEIRKNDYKNALFHTEKALNFAEKSANTTQQAIQTARLGKMYFDLCKHNDAIEKLAESITLFEKLEPSGEQAKAYYYLGLSHLKNKNFTPAEICFNESEAIFEKLEIKEFDELLNLQKAIIHRSRNNFILAAHTFNSIIANPNSRVYIKAEALYQTGLIEGINTRYNLALKYFERALDLNNKSNNVEQRSNILLAISNIYEKMLDKSNAYTYLKFYLNLKETIDIQNNEKLGINDFENFKETERLKKLEKLNQEKRETERTERFSKLINILSFALIVILSLLSLSLYKNNLIKKKSNQLLTDKNHELELAKENAERASNARSEFLSTVSHELRTPLNAINGITHLLLEEKPKKSQLHYLESLQFSGNHLTSFINDILEINKIDSKKFEIEQIDFNLKQLLEDIKNSLEEIALKNNNRFILTIDPYIPDNLIGDPTKLSQIFINLINNALKFTKNGSVEIVAKLKSTTKNDVTLGFKVIDTGIGIPADKLETVFDSFSQGSVEINRKYGGTGLGLTIVKKLINLLGSDIKLKSVVDKGTIFSFNLNLKINANKPTTEINLVAETDEYKHILKGKKALIVEDNKINQMITRKMLQNREMVCEVIDNGEDAIKAVIKNKYDIVLMDVHLPGINGTIATEEIRKFDSTTPIIAVTAISLNENREMLLSFGMDDVITKPFAPEDFYRIISMHLNANVLKSVL